MDPDRQAALAVAHKSKDNSAHRTGRSCTTKVSPRAISDHSSMLSLRSRLSHGWNRTLCRSRVEHCPNEPKRPIQLLS